IDNSLLPFLCPSPFPPPLSISPLVTLSSLLLLSSSPVFLSPFLSSLSLSLSPFISSSSSSSPPPPGVLFLQLGDEIRRVHITHELTSMETLHALLVHMFPQKLTMGVLRSPSTAILLLWASFSMTKP